MKRSRLFVPAVAGAAVMVCAHAQAQCPTQFEREKAAWATTTGNTIGGYQVRSKITINRTLKNDQDGTEQHVVTSSGNEDGLYYQFRESQADCMKVSDGFGGYEFIEADWVFDSTPGAIVSEPFTQDFDLEAAYDATDTGGAENIHLFRHLYEGGQHRVAYKTRTHGPAGSWSPSSSTSHSYFHSSSSTIKDIELTIDRGYDNTPVAAWLEDVSGDFRVRCKMGVSGTAETLSTSGTDAMTPRIASFTDGTIYVTWIEVATSGSEDLKYMMRVYGSFAGGSRTWWPPLNQGAYQFEGAPDMNETAGPMSIAVGPDGYLHMAYVADRVDDHDFVYRNFRFEPNPSNLALPGVLSAQEAIALTSQEIVKGGSDIAVDSYGAVHVAYEYHPSGTNVGYRIRENGTWSAKKSLSVMQNLRPCVCLDAEENLHVVAGSNADEPEFKSAIKRVWTKEAGGGVETGPGQWVALAAFDSWSGPVRNGGATWDVSEDQPYDFTATSNANDIHESLLLYWFWTRNGGAGSDDDVFWHARIRVPGESSILFDYLAGNTGSLTDRWEMQARLMDGLPLDGGGRIAASNVLGNRFPASSTLQSPVSGNSPEGPTYRGLEFYNADDDAHYVAPHFRHQIMTSKTGDDSGQVTFNRLWWRVREQGVLETSPMAISSMSPTSEARMSGTVNVTVTGTGFDSAAVLVEVFHEAAPIVSRSATHVTFQVDSDALDFGTYPVIVINPTSAVFEMVDGGFAITP